MKTATSLRRARSAATISTPPRHWGQVSAALTLLTGGWLLISTFALPYPFTIDGQDARLRATTLGVLLVVLAAARIRAPRSAWRSGVGCGVLGAILMAMPLLLDYRPGGALGVVWWNHLLTGATVTVLSLTGLAAIFLPINAFGDNDPRKD